MPNPTTNYSWQLPLEGDDPWFTRLYTAVGQVDATVHSVAQVGRQRSRFTVVLSAYCTTTTTFMANCVHAVGSWTTVSYAPFGPLVAPVTVLRGGPVRFDFQCSLRRSDNGGAAGLVPYVRVVLNGTNAQSAVLPNFGMSGNSFMVLNVTKRRERMHFQTHVLSLGRGTYFASVQFQPVLSTGSADIAVSSQGYVLLTALEVSSP